MPTMRLCPTCGGTALSSVPPQMKTMKAPAAQMGQAPGLPPASGTVRSATRISPAAYQPMSAVRAFAPAGHGPRLLAAGIDLLILVVLSGAAGALTHLLAIPTAETRGVQLAPAIGLLLGIALPYIYFTIMHSSARAATWGKMAAGIVVVTIQGERLTKSQAFIRVLLQQLLPIAAYVVLAISLGSMIINVEGLMATAAGIAFFTGFIVITLGPYLAVFFSSQHQTLIDMICKTCVIKKQTP